MSESKRSGIPLGEWSGSDATRALHETIKAYQEESGRQTAKMIRLTEAITLLTVVMLLGLALQIYLTVWPLR